MSATFRAASGSLANFVFAISGLDGGALERLLPVQVVGEKVSPSQDCNAIAPPQPRRLQSNATVAPFCSNFPPRGGDGVQFSAGGGVEKREGEAQPRWPRCSVGVDRRAPATSHATL